MRQNRHVATAIFGDALLDPATGELTREAVVLIENGRVTASGARSKVQAPRDGQRIDAEGLTLLPGLIDCHVHLCVTGTTYDLGERLGRPPSLTLLQAVDACAKDLAAGFTACIRQPGALALVVPAAAQTFARGVLTVLTVVIALDLFGLGSAGVGWLSAVLGAGGLLVGPIAVMLVRGKRVARSFAAGVAGWGAPMILLGFAHGAYWPYLMFGVIGVANVFDDVGVYSSLQQVIPPRLMGRALGVRRGLLLLSMGLGSAVTPLLIDEWGARGTLIATGLLLVVLAAVFLPRLTAIDGKIFAPGPDLALLRGVSCFRPLPFAIVEHVASELQTTVHEPGDTIIREGEPGELFYIIAAGQARAAKDGNQLREMSTGDSFGEIALLRRIPRTATVTAVSRVETRALSREEFLAAVTGNPESVDRAEEVVSTRLQAG